MNATLVVSISVLMIGAAIAIYTFLTGNTLADGEDFSLKFAAEVTSSEDGDVYDSEIYFCTGANCKYYEDMYSEYDFDYDLPEFFALVGIDAGDGKKVLTELTLGWMFIFKDDVLTNCTSLSGNETDYDPIEEAKEVVGGASMSSFDVGSTIDLGDTSITITSHDITYNPEVKEATVLGLKMPTPDDCGALNPAPVFRSIATNSSVHDGNGRMLQTRAGAKENCLRDPLCAFRHQSAEEGWKGLEDWHHSCSKWVEGDCSEMKPFHSENNPPRPFDQDDSNPTASTSKEMWKAAVGAYDGNTEGHFKQWMTCEVDIDETVIGWLPWEWTVTGYKRAQFFYRCDDRGCNMNLAFAGSDDHNDWVKSNANLNEKVTSSGNYHGGFYKYQNTLAPCVNHYRNMLKGWGIEIDYIVGHSLGGAAATVYAQEHKDGLKGTVTFGAPKSNLNSVTVPGWRFFHQDDPVPTNLLGALENYNHAISSSYKVYDKTIYWTEETESRERVKRESCARKWWKFWCWFEWVYETVKNLVTKSRVEKKIAKAKKNDFGGGLGATLLYGAATRHSAYGDYPSKDL